MNEHETTKHDILFFLFFFLNVINGWLKERLRKNKDDKSKDDIHQASINNNLQTGDRMNVPQFHHLYHRNLRDTLYDEKANL